LINRSRLPFKDLAGLSPAAQRPWTLNDQSSWAWHWTLIKSSTVHLRISHAAAAIAWSLCRFSISPPRQDSLLITAFVLLVCPSSPCVGVRLPCHCVFALSTKQCMGSSCHQSHIDST
jgi:hypothetical protein